MNIKSKYNITLLVENCISAEIWKPEIEDFKNKLNIDSQFNTINNYNFNMGENLLIKDENNNIINLLEQKTNENNLVLIISDARSMLWKNGELYTVLNELKNTSLVSFVSLLPTSMFMVQSIGNHGGIRSDIIGGSQNNNQITIDEEEKEFINPNSLVLPSTNITQIDNLLDTLINGGALENIQVFKNNIFKAKKNSREQTPEEIAEQIYKRYDQLCLSVSSSIEPFQLAAFFAIEESFTLSDLDFIRQKMLPDSNKNLLSQVMVGGIVEKVNANNEEQRYKMKEGVDKILRRSLTRTEHNIFKLLLDEKNTQNSENSKTKKIRF